MSPSKSRLVAMLSFALAVGLSAYHPRAGEPDAKDDKNTEKPKGDKESILGSWTVVGVEENGKDASDTDEGKKHKGALLTISADKAVFKAEDEVKEFTYKIDPDAKPKTIDFDDDKGQTLKGVYSLDGNSLKICGPHKFGGDRPAVVGTKEGSDSFLLVLKREAKDKAKDK